jgi:hypothetical protein
MPNNELIENLNNNLGFRNVKIKRIENHKDYLLIVLDNDQKVLTNGKEVYNVSDYDNFVDIFPMGNRLCTVLLKSYTHCLIDLKTMEVLFEDRNAYSISKQDDRTLHVIKKIGGGNTTIYDIETKKYLPVPVDYEFENSLGNGMYVFCEEDKEHEENFYNQKRCVINVDGKTLLTDVEGWIYYNDNHLIIIKRDELSIIGVNEDTTYNIKTLKPNEIIIAKPQYYKGNIIVVEKNAVKIYNTALEILKNIEIDDLNEVADLEWVGDVLKLCLTYTVDERKINRHVFINLINSKVISHMRLETYPYWTPTTFIGHDSTNKEFLKYGNSEELIDFNFYDSNFNLIAKVQANSYESVDDDKECMFFLRTKTDDRIKKQLLNSENGSIKEVNYDFVKYHCSIPYGYGGCSTKETIDFFNENLEIVIPDFGYKKYHLNLGMGGFNYFIINDYICVTAHFVDNYDQSQWRIIIQKANGEVVLDSVKHQCYALGNYIQIVSNGQSQFLNTITGEIGNLELTAPITEEGKIDFTKLNNISDILRIEVNNILMLQSGDESTQNVKKLKPNFNKKDD